MVAEGRLQDSTVVVDDPKEASALLSKGGFGTPRSGGATALSLLEASFLVGEGRLRVKGNTAASLLAEGAAREAGFEVLYLVHRDLRGRTLPLKRSDAGFLAWPRGKVPGKDAADTEVLVLSERSPIVPADLARRAGEAAAAKRALLVAVADEEGDVTYYAVKVADPRGQAPEPKGAPAKAAGVVLADRVLVAAPPPALREAGYGRDVGAGLQLPFLEALHLARLGWVDVAEDTVRKAASAHDPEFALKEQVWRDLRARGLLVRTGLKFGTHFRAYRKAADTEHAPYLIHALPPAVGESTQKVAGFVRLAHAVRKTLLFALVEPEGAKVAYLALERTRP